MATTQFDELGERMNSLKETHDLTGKQAAILAAFDADPGATYSDIADEAGDLLDGETISVEYTRAVVYDNRPGYFQDDSRIKPDDVSDDEWVEARASVFSRNGTTSVKLERTRWPRRKTSVSSP